MQDQGRGDRIKAWVDRKVESGGAIVHPAGTHCVERKTTFQQRLNSCRDIDELEGFANRRRYDPTLPKWSDSERAAIVTRKTEMLNVRRKG